MSWKKGVVVGSSLILAFAAGLGVNKIHANGVEDGQSGTGTLAWYYCSQLDSTQKENLIGYQHVQPGEEAHIPVNNPTNLDDDSVRKVSDFLKQINDPETRDNKTRIIGLVEINQTQNGPEKIAMSLGYFPRSKWDDPNHFSLTSVKNQLAKTGCNDGLTHDRDRE